MAHGAMKHWLSGVPSSAILALFFTISRIGSIASPAKIVFMYRSGQKEPFVCTEYHKHSRLGQEGLSHSLGSKDCYVQIMNQLVSSVLCSKRAKALSSSSSLANSCTAIC